MNRLVLLGCTGNVGRQVLEVVDKYPDRLAVFALGANRNIELLEKQIEKYEPSFVAVADEEKGRELERRVHVPVFRGEDASLKLAELEGYDTLINAVVGLAGIRATLAGIRKKRKIALANKETLVAAGKIVMQEARKNGVRIMPIDSEHSALFQCLNGEDRKTIHQLIITCSGGALRDKTRQEMENVTLEDVLGHKTWNMGKKITVDSATLMNKGFEVIEAMWLYDLPVEKIKVVIHPESCIHSMVEYSDGSIMAQISEPDMRLPIQYALSCPERWAAPIKRFDFSKNLTFHEPDLERFPCLDYALHATKELGTLPAVMNAANDLMVGKFLKQECEFLDIERVVKEVMDRHRTINDPSLKDIEEAINWSKREVEALW